MQDHRYYTEDMTYHAVTSTEVLNYLTGSERLTCSCGWSGHRNYWTTHGADVPALPTTTRPPVPRDVLRRAIYGDRR